MKPILQGSISALLIAILIVVILLINKNKNKKDKNKLSNQVIIQFFIATMLITIMLIPFNLNIIIYILLWVYNLIIPYIVVTRIIFKDEE